MVTIMMVPRASRWPHTIPMAAMITLGSKTPHDLFSPHDPGYRFGAPGVHTTNMQTIKQSNASVCGVCCMQSPALNARHRQWRVASPYPHDNGIGALNSLLGGNLAVSHKWGRC